MASGALAGTYFIMLLRPRAVRTQSPHASASCDGLPERVEALLEAAWQVGQRRTPLDQRLGPDLLGPRRLGLLDGPVGPGHRHLRPVPQHVDLGEDGEVLGPLLATRELVGERLDLGHLRPDVARAADLVEEPGEEARRGRLGLEVAVAASQALPALGVRDGLLVLADQPRGPRRAFQQDGVVRRLGEGAEGEHERLVGRAAAQVVVDAVACQGDQLLVRARTAPHDGPAAPGRRGRAP